VVDSGNAPVITREVIAVGLDAGTFGVALGGGSVLSADSGSTALSQALARPRATIQSVQPSVTIGPERFDCLVSGSVRLSGSIASPDRLSPGDRITADFSDCDDADGAVFDGRMRLDVNSFSGDIYTDLFALGARMTLTDLAVTEDGITTVGDGIAEIDLDLTVPLKSSLTLAGDRLEIRSGSRAWVLRDFAVTELEDGTGVELVTENYGSGTLEGDGFEGAADFVAVGPLVSVDGNFPSTGEVLITGANGATIRATVLDAISLQLAIDFNGDSVVDETQQLLWSAVGSL